MSESLIVEKTGAVGTVRVNRPDKHNALNAQLSHVLIDAHGGGMVKGEAAALAVHIFSV